jgi:hypothetical protein
MLLLFAVAAAAPLHFHVDATEFANTVYHTVCTTGRMSCSRDIYMRFWNERYKVTPEDGKHFDAFTGVLDELEKAAPAPRPLPYLPNDWEYAPAFEIRPRVVAAMFGSKSPADFRRRARKLMTAAQAERIGEVLEYFGKRLHPWWVATGQPIVAKHIKDIQTEFSKSGVAATAAEVAAFLEARPESRDCYLHAVPSPEYDGDHADGTAIGNHFAVELTHKAKGSDAAWVAIHEFTHAMYQLAPRPRKDALMQQFVEAGDASGQAFYMYLNEALATAVEILQAERQGLTLDEPYTDPYIPRLAKAVVPILRAALAKRETLYDGFTRPYLAAGRAELGDDADGLQFRFSVVALVAEPDVQEAFLEGQRVHYHVGKDAWSRYPKLNGLLIMRYDQIHFDGEKEFEDAMAKHRGFVAVRQEEEHMTAFVLGRDNATLMELGKKWWACKEKVREGVIYWVD